MNSSPSNVNIQDSHAESYGVRFVAAAVGAAVVIGGIWFYLHRDRPAPTGLASLSVPAGFKVERAAGSDLVSYPMMATFDDRGRLFICESSGNTLNNDQMAANPDYKIRLLEDRDGDGVFDQGKVFAEKLTLPAGAVWYRNSLYVASPPDLLRFEDTNGDGVADVQRSRRHRLEDVRECRQPAWPDLRS